MTIFRSSRFLLALAAGILLFGTTLSAAPILSGSFDFSGSITVVGTTAINWSLPPTNEAQIGTTGPALTGSFSGTATQDIMIDGLTNPPDVVGSPGFADQTFITFLADPTFPTLMINYISPGVYSSTECGSSTVGMNCTLAGSPFNFTNDANGSTASFDLSGVTSDGKSKWTGIFTVQFIGESYPEVFAGLKTTGSVTNTYSADFLVTPIPEPGSILLVLLGVGMIVGSWRRKRHVA